MNKFIVMSLFAIGASNLYGDYNQNPSFNRQNQRGSDASSHNQHKKNEPFRNYNGSQSMPYYTINEEAFKDINKNTPEKRQGTRQQYYYYGSDSNDSSDDNDNGVDDNTYYRANRTHENLSSNSWFNTGSNAGGDVSPKNLYYNQGQPQNTDSKNDTYTTEGDRRLGHRIRDAIKGGWFSKGYEQVQLNVSNGIVTLRGFVATFEDRKNVEDTVKKVNGVKGVKNNLNIKQSDRKADANTPYERAQSMNKNPSQNRNLMDDKKKDRHGTMPSKDSFAAADSSWFNTSRDSSAYQNTDSHSWFGTSKDNTYAQDIGTTDGDRQLNKKIREALGKGWFIDKYENIKLNTSNGVVTIQGFVATYDDHRKLNEEIRKMEGVRAVNNQAKVKESTHR
ncbi:MAG: BON domain-containing protein [Parachlamydiaceae bacterium]